LILIKNKKKIGKKMKDCTVTCPICNSEIIVLYETKTKCYEVDKNGGINLLKPLPPEKIHNLKFQCVVDSSHELNTNKINKWKEYVTLMFQKAGWLD
jgi:hypothetical protein